MSLAHSAESQSHGSSRLPSHGSSYLPSHTTSPPACLPAGKLEIIERLEIDTTLLKLWSSKKGSDLHLTFKAYEASVAAVAKWRDITDEEWPNKPTPTEITSIWIQKTQYSKWAKAFNSVIESYPDMQKWLEDAPDKKSNEEVWGSRKGGKLGFNALSTWVKVRDDKKNTKKKPIAQ